MLELPVSSEGQATYIMPLHLVGEARIQRIPATVLTVHPAYVLSGGATMWHVVRAAYMTEYNKIVHFYCGQHQRTRIINGLVADWLETDNPASDDPVCGTCVGRAVGAGRKLPRLEVVGDPSLQFTPRGRKPNVWCPGTRLSASWGLEYGDRMTCPICGVEDLRVGLAGTSPWYSSGWVQIRAHRTGVNIVDPCPFHGWKNMTKDGVCACSVEKE